ncbi:MAG TPA: protein kinase family protein [Candidatus Saccharimonadales bacterium]|nr:protein kinase family protein [Candidatus Saccharimonadales bacterium]
MNKEDLIIKDYVERFEPLIDGEKFTRLYADQKPEIQKIFAYFHQQFNYLFDFLNQKNTVNKHYNAHESRELIELIDVFEEFQYSLKQVGHEIVLAKSYQDAIKECRGFLSSSGGSTIPDTFVPITVIRYDQILEQTNKTVKVTGRNTTYSLVMVGQGAFSIVQRYKDPFYNRDFAVKQAKKTSTERELARFRKEYEILSKLSFPYILEVYSYDESKNSYVMECCDTTLYDYITQNNTKLKFLSRKRIALQFLYGINYLHLRSILHRDVSYRNVLIKKYDYGAAVVKLSDFGLMKEDTSEFTKSDTDIKGTIIDPSLEKFKDYNVQNEIYAVGFILNFVFTGKHNLVNNNTEINKIIMKCTDRDPKKRYESVTELINDMEKLSEV